MSATPRTGAAVELLVDLAMEWRTSGLPLRHLLRRHAARLRRIDSTPRRQLEQALFDLARHRSRAEDAAAHASAALRHQATAVPRRRQLLLTLAAAERLTDTSPGLATTSLTAPEHDALIAAVADPPPATNAAGLALTTSFPVDVARELIEVLGLPQASEALTALNQRAPLVLRARPPLDGPGLRQALALADVEADLHPLVPGAVVCQRQEGLSDHPLLRAGQAAVQDAAAQLAVQLLDVQPGQVIVDSCAGGGGKASAIADRLGASGRLVLMDVDHRRLERARARLAPASPSVHLIVHDGLEPPPAELWGSADKVLIDAPCSGLGTVRRHPDLKWRYTAADIEQLAERQEQLCLHATRLLKPGGLLLYATCSLRRRENQEVSERLLQRGLLEATPLSTVAPALAAALGADDHHLTLWPHRHACDGFFVALFRRVR